MANTIVVSLVGDASRLTKSMSDAQRRVSLFGVAATAALVKFGVSSTKAFLEREEAQNKLNVSLAQSTKLSGLTAASFADYNTALAETTAIDDDVIAGAEAILARFAQSGAQLKQLTEITLDYSRATGTEVTASATAVGKAILGNTKALKGLGISYTLTGDKAKDSAAIQGLLADKLQGTAEAFAKTDAGKLEEMQRKYGELQETIGAGLLPALTGLVDIITPVVEAFSKMKPGVQQSIFGLTLLGAVSLAVVPKLLSMRASILASQVSMQSLKVNAVSSSIAMRGFMAAMGPIGIAITVATVALSAFAMKSEATNQVTKDLTATLDENTGAFTQNTVAQIASNLRDNGVLDALEEAGVGYDGLAEAIAGGTESTNAWLVANPKAAASNLYTKDTFWSLTGSATTASDEILSAAGSADDAASAFDQTSAAADGTTQATIDMAAKTDALKKKIDELVASFTILRQGFLDQRTANRSYQSALDDASAALKENGKGLNDNTEAGRKNADALDAVATASNDVITSMVKNGASVKDTMTAYRQQRADLLETAKSFGMGKKAADNYVDSVLKTPDAVRTKVITIGAKEAKADIDGLGSAIKAIPTLVTTTVTASGSVQRGAVAKADGGLISGPGTGRSDSILARLSNGEYVIQADAVKKYGAGFLNAVNSKKFADGGAVGSLLGASSSDDLRGLWASLKQMLKGTNGLNWDAMQKTFDRLKDTAKSFDRVSESLAKARDDFASLKSTAADFTKSVQDGLRAQAGISGLVVDGGDNSGAALAQRFGDRLNTIKRFMKNVNRLAKAGLPASLVREIMEMGAEEGLPLSQALLQDPAAMGKFRAISKQVDRTTAQFAASQSRARYGDRLSAAEREVDRKAARKGNLADRMDKIERNMAGKIADSVSVNITVDGRNAASDRALTQAIAVGVREEIKKIEKRQAGRAKA